MAGELGQEDQPAVPGVRLDTLQQAVLIAARQNFWGANPSRRRFQKKHGTFLFLVVLH
jgi:hypothetical protein